MAGDSIKFNASLNTAAFESGAKKLGGVAASAATGISQHFGKIAMAVAGITAAFLGVRAAVQSFNAAIAMGGQLNDLSARTGETAGNLAILQRAFQNAGAGAEAVGPTINRLQRAIVEAGEGGKQQAEAFAKLGLNLEDIKTKTPTEQLQAVAQALQGVGNDSDRSAIAMQLLGRSGGELLPLLRAMGVELDTARGQLGSLPEIIDRTNVHLDQIGDNFAAIGEKGKEFMVGLLEKLAPGLADLTDRLANIDAAGFGAKLSEYAEKTVSWIAETFKLNDAISNLEVAIGGITSGNFGDGLKLMFLTARDTALNAINNIVAAAGAALQTIGAAIAKLFASGSTTMAFIEGSFQMLGAKLASGIFDALATVLEKLPFMGAAAAAVREAQKEAEEAIEDISNIMYYEADNLKSEWGGIMSEMPKEFARSYQQNMEKPLFDMKDRATETADQMERVAAATRAAAFDAEAFGQALRDAQVDRLAGSPADGESPMSQNPDGKKFPWQGAGAGPSNGQVFDGTTRNTAPTVVGGGGGGGGGSNRPPPIDPLAAGRIGQMQGRYDERINNLMGQGNFGTAGRLAERRDERVRDRENFQRSEDFASDRFGGNNFGESFRNYLEDLAKEGIYSEGITREQFEEWAKGQAKTDEERKKEEEAGQTPGSGGGKGSDGLGGIGGKLDTIIKEITERLPQVAMGTS